MKREATIRMRPRFARVSALLLAAVACLQVNPAGAERVQFRVAFERVPGLEQIEAGNLEAGIRILKNQLESGESNNEGDVLATLCAALIVSGSLSEAEQVCDRAIEVKPGNTAYNNRGVLRAHTGNLKGARQDFERVRPQELDAYLDQLWETDVPLMANGNFDLVDRMLKVTGPSQIRRSFTESGAAIKNIKE